MSDLFHKPFIATKNRKANIRPCCTCKDNMDVLIATVQWPCQGWSDFISKQSGDMLQESEKLFSPTGQKLAIGSDSERVENVFLKDEMRITDVLVLERLAMKGGWKNELY
ncbi:hypothetical protein FOTG_14265 [Fusarium oxysporum f. sp. vasinfectum 25433]|uniref:Uncharacterized protein n=1 Tax=Fusarium oxysporum f. sp. vasinfectum 25433 TaxID=1089449 RepID=X0KVB6_FUSOX|nr:hypothetical protein FOTG_14265 [Fusarium oxysporum f. sp. vasinfectum 25433]